MTRVVTSWSEVPIKNVLTYLDERIELDDATEYITITVKRNHGGLEARETLFGHQIQTKKQFRLIPGAFILSRVQCWHQAYAIVPNDIPANMIASTNYDQFAISNDVDPRFFWWLSYSPAFTETVRSSAFGVVIEKMVFNRDDWLEKTIPLPPLDEQRRIVARIDALAARIEEARGLRREATEEAEAFITSAINRSLEGIECSGHLGDVLCEKPRNGWSVVCDNNEDGIPVLSLSAVTGFRYRRNQFKRTSEPTSPDGHYWLNPRDLLITRSNTPELVGHAAIYDGYPSPCIYPDLMMRLNVDEQHANKYFVHWWLRSSLARDFIQERAKGTSPSMRKISQDTVMEIPFPSSLSLDEQRRIVAYLDELQAKADALKHLQTEAAAELEALLPAVLDQAFRGEL